MGDLGGLHGEGGISAETFCSRGRVRGQGASGRGNSVCKAPEVGR